MRKIEQEKTGRSRGRDRWPVLMLAAVGLSGLLPLGMIKAAPPQGRTIVANVVALDQAFAWNRLGVLQPHGMMYALRRDVVDTATGLSEAEGGVLSAGNVRLRSDKRPRPLVLRANEGDTLVINFQNLLFPSPRDNEQPATRYASIHIVGMEAVGGVESLGMDVGGNNNSGLVAPNGTTTYTLSCSAEGAYSFYSGAAMTGGQGDGGSIGPGLFGQLNVEPYGSSWYRSQVTAADLALGVDPDNANSDPANPGYTPDGHPIVDYGAVYPAGHAYAGLPIFDMLSGNEIVHSDLTAIISGFASNHYNSNPVYPRRNESFREFTIIYHDEVGAVQAFPIFNDAQFEHTLHSVRDAFAINYGTGGIGAEIVANRLGVGPMWDCTGCKYEEFFLTSWVVGDPAMVVDVPANTTDANRNLITGAKASQAYYPDDPSNVYHSYLRDHVKMRLSHGGPKEHHIHHLHAHQWLQTPNAPSSAYLDSQAFGPGSSYTLEMVYDGSGNRNQTVGDSIFHCHFYPHFAQGMWAHWRVHDVLEDGSRLLPDGEIPGGTPIPAVVPVPGKPMAPMPGATVDIVAMDANQDGLPDSSQIAVSPLPGATEIGNPGFPFFVPGIAGHRPPHPPLDTVWDGGLPRHVLTSTFDANSNNLAEVVAVATPYDFTKEIHKVAAFELPETGTAVELEAMAFHAQRYHDSYMPDGSPATGNQGFITNGMPAQAGAPFADPCMDDNGNPLGVDGQGNALRTYKAANIQIDAVLNKTGWHFPQMRIITLWGDVADTFSGARAPEPFFFRARSGECIEFHHTNLTPGVYEMDDFQVRTPTDILGQHIHLVKFDVTASDGSGNGWNYEDATFSPDEVRERIHALNEFDPDPAKSGFAALDGSYPVLEEQPHPYFGAGPNGAFLGAQTTIQRWMADDVLDLSGNDRTLRTVFTHDHYGPSTHQQAGLYAGLLVEPADAVWRDPETGVAMGDRFDGGPTSWRVDVITGPNGADSYREFMFEFADFQLAYRAGSHPNLPSAGGPVLPLPWDPLNPRVPGTGFDNPLAVVNPPGKVEVGLPFLQAPPGIAMPEAISADDVGTMSVNYRNEPVALRVQDPNSNTQANGLAGDLSYAFHSTVNRARNELNAPPALWPYGAASGSASFDAQTGDPITPLLRAYETDRVQIRMLVGATEETHNFNFHGIKWKVQPSWSDSGWASSQLAGISEHFEFNAPTAIVKGDEPFMDYMYQTGSATDDIWNGLWGIMRVYNGGAGIKPDLVPLPNNPDGKAPPMKNPRDFRGPCPRDAFKRTFSIVAGLAQDLLPEGAVTYNGRAGLNDPTSVLYVHKSDLDKKTGRLKAGVGVEPLILRAAAGDCIEVTLTNNLPAQMPDLDGYFTLPMIVDNFNANQVQPSAHVGLHAQLANYSVTQDDGANVGFNPIQTVAPGAFAKSTWYAGDITVESDGTRTWEPLEFGTINLQSSDRIKHSGKGAVGVLVVEPMGSTWVEDAGTRTMATVTRADGSKFRDFVVVLQSDVNLRYADGTAVELLAETEDNEDSGHKAVNYRTEPFWVREGFAVDAPLTSTRTIEFVSDGRRHTLHNSRVGGGDPETPVFTAARGQEVMFRVAKPGGNARAHVFAVQGHNWQEVPYTHDANDPKEARLGSCEIGWNNFSQIIGSQMGIGPSSHLNIRILSAGGVNAVPGDYLWRDNSSFQFDGGLWGILRVQ